MLQDFYQVHRRHSEQGLLLFHFTFNAQHPIFQGHFPDQPVVPGVCILQILLEELNRELDAQCEIDSIVQAKFLKALLPDSFPVAAKLHFDALAKGYKIDATLTKNQQITTKIKATVCI